MRFLAIAVIALTLQGQSPSPSAATTSAPSAPVTIALTLLDTMLRTGHADPGWFSASFLAQIPASKVDQVIASLIGTLGAYQSVELKPDKFVAHFAKGTDDVLIHLDTQNKIDGLLFRPPNATGASANPL